METNRSGQATFPASLIRDNIAFMMEEDSLLFFFLLNSWDRIFILFYFIRGPNLKQRRACNGPEQKAYFILNKLG